MEFGIGKFAMLIMKTGKRSLRAGIELPNHKIRTLKEKETYKYYGNLEVYTIKQVKMKERIKKEYVRRTRKWLETKLSSRYLIKWIHTCAVLLVRYSRPFLKWPREELKQMDQRTRKLMTMHKAVHSIDDVERLYVSRKEGGRGLANIEDSVDSSIQRLEDYIEKDDEDWFQPSMGMRMTITRKQKWSEKQLCWRFKWLINHISLEKTWTWLRKRNFKRET